MRSIHVFLTAIILTISVSLNSEAKTMSEPVNETPLSAQELRTPNDISLHRLIQSRFVALGDYETAARWINRMREVIEAHWIVGAAFVEAFSAAGDFERLREFVETIPMRESKREDLRTGLAIGMFTLSRSRGHIAESARWGHEALQRIRAELGESAATPTLDKLAPDNAHWCFRYALVAEHFGEDIDQIYRSITKLPGPSMFKALAHAALGDIDSAMEFLQYARQEGQVPRWMLGGGGLLNGRLGKLNTDSRFQAFVADMHQHNGALLDWMRNEIPQVFLRGRSESLSF